MSSSDIAIVGMACIFPGAKDLSQFWFNIVNGVDFTTESSPKHPDTEEYIPLNLSSLIDTALKDADITWDDETQAGADLIIHWAGYPDKNLNSFFAENKSFSNLIKTGYIINDIHASPLIAVKQAINRLRQGHCDVAIVGGIYTHDKYSCTLELEKIISPCIDGISISWGAGVVVLKREEDAKHCNNRMYAIIKGAQIKPETIGYLEADAIVIGNTKKAGIETLKSFFDQRHKEKTICPVGSIKSMIGHTISAAGIASLIKVALCLSNKIIPPAINCDKTKIKLKDAPFYINTQIYPWIHDISLAPRRAAINILGFNETGIHLVLEEVPEKKGKSFMREIKPGLEWETDLIVFSARDLTELLVKIQKLQQFLEKNQMDLQLEDIAYTQYLHFVESYPHLMA
ncbi:hypothetical protein IBX65_06180, partial [Candidatus Aerophobetes bacterium]|nr:hypothetical protein [Candidatus Aerophobetes bacterium]